jgi:hypothetical protein
MSKPHRRHNKYKTTLNIITIPPLLIFLALDHFYLFDNLNDNLSDNPSNFCFLILSCVCVAINK